MFCIFVNDLKINYSMQLSKKDVLEQANKACKNTLMETLNIEITDFGDDFLVARMPVNSRVHQPDGVLHGGATVALAESVGSFASHIFMDTEKFFIRGIEITANHLKSVKEGFVYAKATFLHKGRTTQLLDIRVTDEADNLISICKLSTISLPKNK
ncbi:PaaI family thioesterase [Algibacter agarivorans]|uniref:PaaI family thioesterase n=2 Tax=Algibacter agarivorans TaxID=1109741 RepID=A0ABP9GKU3_9FLAO